MGREDTNTSANGLVVNGNDVIAYGLFVEHHQQCQVVWNGNRGRTYFYQSEIPYDPPSQTIAAAQASTAGPLTKWPAASRATRHGAGHKGEISHVIDDRDGPTSIKPFVTPRSQIFLIE